MAETEFCCAGLQKLVNDWQLPFYKPVYIDAKHSLHADKIGIQLFNLTPSRKSIAAKGRSTFFLNYCPVCGTKISRDAQEA